MSREEVPVGRCGAALTPADLPSKLPYDVTPEQAMSHQEVRTRLEASIKNMKAVTDRFLSAIVVSVEKIPYVGRPSPAVGLAEPDVSPPSCLSPSGTGCVSSPRC